MAIEQIAVIGAGQMGAGIAQVCAQAGYGVVLRDIKDEFVERGMDTIKGSLAKFVDKGKLAQTDADTALGRIQPTTRIEDCKDADLVIEAIIEDADTKVALFKDLDKACKDGCILASNTSSIPITKLASATKRPQLVIGMHFMNPVPLMQLVEVIRGHDTSDATTKAILDVATHVGKTPVEVHDFPGFVSNRILLPMLNEAMFALHEGVGSIEAIDTVMKLGMNHPMGPLELADYVGLDTCLAILEVLYDGFNDPKYRPCPLLKQKVMAGHYGRKTGRGFYVWEKGRNAGPA